MSATPSTPALMLQWVVGLAILFAVASCGRPIGCVEVDGFADVLENPSPMSYPSSAPIENRVVERVGS
jgi:hypothetical protein